MPGDREAAYSGADWQDLTLTAAGGRNTADLQPLWPHPSENGGLAATTARHQNRLPDRYPPAAG